MTAATYWIFRYSKIKTTTPQKQNSHIDATTSQWPGTIPQKISILSGGLLRSKRNQTGKQIIKHQKEMC